MLPNDPNGPALQGIRILDLTRVLSGPYATLLLADLGAEVWKIEYPVDGDETRGLPPHRGGESHYFMTVNRNKASLGIDLKDPRGRDPVLRMSLTGECGRGRPSERRAVVVGAPLKFTRAGNTEPTPAPLLGADTRDVLHSVLGVDPETLDSLEGDGVLAAS
jgi:crotonobetainyl-CoA:carnitine CoA-transferase CaiB-like acyl-CoA transferase